MKSLALAAALVGLVACHRIGGPCCSNQDCPSNSICSVECTPADTTLGTCLAPCFVDKDCAPGEVCDVFILTCGCQQLDAGERFDGGLFGTCSGNVGN